MDTQRVKGSQRTPVPASSSEANTCQDIVGAALGLWESNNRYAPLVGIAIQQVHHRFGGSALKDEKTDCDNAAAFLGRAQQTNCANINDLTCAFKSVEQAACNVACQQSRTTVPGR